MTLRTITIDDSTHKVVPLEPTNEMLEGAFNAITAADEHFHLGIEARLYDFMISAAPEYSDDSLHQEPEKKFSTSCLEKGKIYNHSYLGRMEYLGTDTYFGEFTFKFYHFRDWQTRYFKPDRVETEFVISE